MDMSEFDLRDKEEDDYNLFDFFIMKPDYPLQPLIGYRIKLLLKNDTFLFIIQQLFNTQVSPPRKTVSFFKRSLILYSINGYNG